MLVEALHLKLDQGERGGGEGEERGRDREREGGEGERGEGGEREREGEGEREKGEGGREDTHKLDELVKGHQQDMHKRNILLNGLYSVLSCVHTSLAISWKATPYRHSEQRVWRGRERQHTVNI